MGITQQIGASSLIKPGVIDNTAARPASPFEGQMVYEKDTDMIAIWNGTAWRYIAAATATSGSVLQVVSASTTTSTLINTGSYVDVTNLNATITPKSTSSKILISCTVQAYVNGASTGATFKLVRASTDIFTPIKNLGFASGYNKFCGSFTYMDSPSTISSTTYKIQAFRSAGAGDITVNNDAESSTISLMEIAG